MYPKDKSRFEELKERAGLGRAPNGLLIAVAVLVVALLGYALWSWYGPSSGDDFSAELYGQDASEETTVGNPGGLDVTSADPALQDAGSLTVHVVGAVMEPGVYELEAGARIGDAITAAGGVNPKAEIRAVNFAEVLTDGTQVVVPTVDEVKSGSVTSAGSAAGGSETSSGSNAAGVGVAANGVVNINTANSATLETLPGIGPATAGKIIADREKNGPFKSTSDLQRVSGIGPKKYEALTGLISAQ